MTTTDFLDAILAAPDDDTPRLLYADWLEEHGNPYGEFIRVQVELAGTELHTDRWWRLKDRELELWKVHSPTWFAVLGTVFRYVCIGIDDPDEITVVNWHKDREWGEVRRGFVDEIHCSQAAFLDHAESLFRSQPITKVMLTDREPSQGTTNSTGWAWFDDRRQGGWSLAPYYLPAAIYDLIVWEFDHEIEWSSLDTREAALDALSQACVRYGRGLVQLSELNTPVSRCGENS